MRFLLIFLLLLTLIGLTSAQVTLDENVTIVMGNVTMTFQSAQYDNVYYSIGQEVRINDHAVIITANNTTDVKVTKFDTSTKNFEFLTTSTGNTSVDFRIDTKTPSKFFNITKNGTKLESVITDSNGWLNWTYTGGFSTWLFAFFPVSPITTTTSILSGEGITGLAPVILIMGFMAEVVGRRFGINFKARALIVGVTVIITLIGLGRIV